MRPVTIARLRAVNYWYGMSSGVIDIRYAPGLPYQTRKLVQLLRNGIVEGSINPFGGELHSQDGVVQIEGFPPLPSTQIVEMNWLADNVVGTIPQLDDEPKVRCPMKILAVADTEERCLWECFHKERFEGVDLILSAGDLDPDYLEFLVTVINKPLIYVRGNHDDRYVRHAPGGCICVEDSRLRVPRRSASRGLAAPCATETVPTCTPSTKWPSACASCPAK